MKVYATNRPKLEPFMPPTSKNFRGHIGLGLSVGLSVRPLRLHTVKND